MATKWISTLTGTEMDSALTDMAYHNSEAYAVGTRNGVAVGSSDVTYHNNSKYWAEQVYGYTDRAEDAANRAEAAVPSGTAGAVFFDRAQSLTTAQQSQARANIMAGGSNRNLLDNPFFTVNQRGVSGTISTANAYTVDRWKLSAGSVTISANGVSLLKVGSTQGAYREYIEYDRIKTNEQYTLSVMLQSGEVYSVTGTITPQTAQSGWLINKNFTSDFWGGIRAYSNSGTIVWDICFTSNNTSGVDFRAVKLELGSVSTLANDAPPNYSEELAKCQRYFLKLTDVAYPCMCGANPAVVGVPVPTPVTMPDNVQIQSVSVGWIRGGGNNYSSSASVNNMTPRPKANTIAIDVTHGVSGGLSARTIYWINFSQLVFSADL